MVSSSPIRGITAVRSDHRRSAQPRQLRPQQKKVLRGTKHFHRRGAGWTSKRNNASFFLPQGGGDHTLLWFLLPHASNRATACPVRPRGPKKKAQWVGVSSNRKEKQSGDGAGFVPVLARGRRARHAMVTHVDVGGRGDGHESEEGGCLGEHGGGRRCLRFLCLRYRRFLLEFLSEFLCMQILQRCREKSKVGTGGDGTDFSVPQESAFPSKKSLPRAVALHPAPP